MLFISVCTDHLMPCHACHAIRHRAIIQTKQNDPIQSNPYTHNTKVYNMNPNPARICGATHTKPCNVMCSAIQFPIPYNPSQPEPIHIHTIVIIIYTLTHIQMLIYHSNPPPLPLPICLTTLSSYPTTVLKLKLSRKLPRSSFLTSTTQCSKLSILTLAFVSSTTS